MRISFADYHLRAKPSNVNKFIKPIIKFKHIVVYIHILVSYYMAQGQIELSCATTFVPVHTMETVFNVMGVGRLFNTLRSSNTYT